MKSGLMEKLPDDGGWPKYRLTQKFRSPQPGTRSKESSSTTPSQTVSVVKTQSARPGKPVAALRERLSKHRSDMLCALGEAEEYADLAAFLVSERAAYITGTAINIDGGLSTVT